tara:strand:+ start:764 stop:2308 length:1545 start_codon:yes stop_codon:yes gene_type:complete
LKKKFLFECLLLIIISGLTSLSLPPFNFYLINFLTLSIFFIFLFKRLDRKVSKKKFFFYGWLFGFGYFFFSLYWITISLTFDKSFIFLLPIALILIPSFLALFYSFIALFFCLIKPKNIISAFFTFSFLFGLIEFLRGTILTGFPWNLIVYTFSENLKFISIISLIGTYSLNLIVISLFITPAIFIFRKSKKEIFLTITFFVITFVFLIYGTFQKKEFLDKNFTENPYIIRIISSNINLERFYNDTPAKDVINELISISKPDKTKRIFFLWPEGIIPNTYLDQIKSFAGEFSKNFNENHFIGLGITKRTIKNNKEIYFNSFSILDNNLNILNNYDKNRLVPFGEFLPLEIFLEKIGLKTITNNFGSFTKGNDRKIIKIKNKNYEFSFLPLICYEIIYTGNLSKNFDFDFIANISEDGWFGKSIGPKQHFAHSIFRAIENGKYVTRAANNGMSALINPLGEIEKKIHYGEKGYIDFEKKKDIDKTFFSKYGNIIFLILILLYIFLTISFNRIKDE